MHGAAGVWERAILHAVWAVLIQTESTEKEGCTAAGTLSVTAADRLGVVCEHSRSGMLSVALLGVAQHSPVRCALALAGLWSCSHDDQNVSASAIGPQASAWPARTLIAHWAGTCLPQQRRSKLRAVPACLSTARTELRSPGLTKMQAGLCSISHPCTIGCVASPDLSQATRVVIARMMCRSRGCGGAGAAVDLLILIRHLHVSTPPLTLPSAAGTSHPGRATEDAALPVAPLTVAPTLRLVCDLTGAYDEVAFVASVLRRHPDCTLEMLPLLIQGSAYACTLRQQSVEHVELRAICKSQCCLHAGSSARAADPQRAAVGSCRQAQGLQAEHASA